MALATHALTTLAVVKEDLGFSDNEKDAVLERLINSVSRAFWREAGRALHYEAEIVERVPGYGVFRLRMKRRPVASVTEIVRIDIEGSDLEVLDPTTYEIEDADKGFLYREGGFGDTAQRGVSIDGAPISGSERASIKVTYTGGFVTPNQHTGTPPFVRDLPEDIEEAVLMSVVANWHRKGQNQQATSESNDNVHTSWGRKFGLLLPETLEVARKLRSTW